MSDTKISVIGKPHSPPRKRSLGLRMSGEKAGKPPYSLSTSFLRKLDEERIDWFNSSKTQADIIYHLN